MNKIYTRVNWKDYPDTETPINSENLNKMDEAIDKIDERVATIGNDPILLSNDASKKTTTYTESTASSPPASGSKLPAIIGWCIGKIKALVTDVSSLNSNAVYTKVITTDLTDFNPIDVATYVDNFLNSGQSINAVVTFSTNSGVIIGRKVSTNRARYIFMPRSNNNTYILSKDVDGTFVSNKVVYEES